MKSVLDEFSSDVSICRDNGSVRFGGPFLPGTSPVEGELFLRLCTNI